MQSFSLATLTALICVVVVSTDPQHSPELPSIRSVIHELSSVFGCVPNVVNNTIGDGDFKPEFVQFKQDFDIVLNNLPKCAELESIDQKYNCATDSITQFDHNFADLIEKVSMKDKAVAEKVQTDLKEECMKSSASLLKGIECVANGLDETSAKNGLTNMWKEFEPKVKQHMDAWKECSYQFCKMKEGVYVYSLINQYVETAVTDPNFSKFYEDSLKIFRDC